MFIALLLERTLLFIYHNYQRACIAYFLAIIKEHTVRMHQKQRHMKQVVNTSFIIFIPLIPRNTLIHAFRGSTFAEKFETLNGMTP